MQLTLQASVIVLLCCLLEGLNGLRLIKVSIPAYKLRGESAFLECQYELERRKNQGLQEGYQDTTGSHKGELNYSEDMDSREVEGTYPHPHQHPHPHPHPHPPPYLYNNQQHGEQHYQIDQRQQFEHYKRFRNRKRSTHYQSQQNFQHYQYPQQHQDEWPYQTPPSPYGHSIYRGRSSSSALSSSQYSVNFGTHSGARTHIVNAGTRTREHNGGDGVGVGDDDDDDRFVDSMEDSQQRPGEEEEQEEDDNDDGVDTVGTEIEDEENEELYAIKWYKDNEEFYRYVPKANPPKTSYRVDGVRVIEEHSDSSRVLLRGLTINATGLYRCEISAEAPNFSSVVGEGQMDVVYLPRDGPHIKGQQIQYQIGEMLNLNCTSGKSHPASYLQWYINDKPIVNRSYLIGYNNTVHRHGLITSTLGLHLIVEPKHFNNGAMRVKCVASISPILWKGGKESILQRRPGIIDNREAMLLVHGAATSLHFKDFQKNSLLLIILTFVVKLCQL